MRGKRRCGHKEVPGPIPTPALTGSGSTGPLARLRLEGIAGRAIPASEALSATPRMWHILLVCQ